MKQIIRFVRYFCLGNLLWISLLANSGTLKIVSTIKPIDLILGEIAGPRVESYLLLPQGASPHHFRLKPSDIRRMWGADLVLWVGPNLEIFLAQQIQLLSAKTLVVSLGQGLTDLMGDAHIWLDPQIAIKMGQKIAEILISIDPENDKEYTKNLEKWQEKVYFMDKQVALLFAEIEAPQYILQHRSMDYFQARYNLAHLGVLTSGAEQQTSVRNLLTIDTLLVSGRAKCVIIEPKFPHNIIKSLKASEHSHIIEFDPLMYLAKNYVSAISLFADKLKECV